VQDLRYQGFAVPALSAGTSRRQLKNANQAGARAAVLVHPSGSLTVRDMTHGDQVELGDAADATAVGEALREQGVPLHLRAPGD